MHQQPEILAILITTYHQFRLIVFIIVLMIMFHIISNLFMGYNNMHRITPKLQYLTQENVHFSGILHTGYNMLYINIHLFQNY